MCGTLVYSRGDEVQSKKDHLEYEAHAAEEGEAQPSMLMPGLPQTQFWSQGSLCDSSSLAYLLKSKSGDLSVPSIGSVDHNAVLSQFVFCQVFSPSLSAEGLPLSSPFLSMIISFCCLDLLS